MSAVIPVRLEGRGYEVTVERGLLARAGEKLDLGRRALIVTDGGVPARYAAAVAGQCREALVETVPQGEDSKCFATLERLEKAMLAAGFTRGDSVVAVGGGVVGDLAGLAAALYMRGIDFYNVPTTLLSQVDSSVGGKTAIDLEGVKNIVGAFYQPRAVLIDPDTLETLPRRQVASGLAEALKMACTSEAALFGLFEEDDPFARLEEIISASVRIKAAVVEADEREGGLRRVLNFGHTVGHAVESAAAGALTHGECVAIGMLPMCGGAVRARLAPVLEKLGLPTSAAVDADRARAAILHDKKAAGARVHVVRVEEIGAFRMETMSQEELGAALESVLR